MHRRGRTAPTGCPPARKLPRHAFGEGPTERHSVQPGHKLGRRAYSGEVSRAARASTVPHSAPFARISRASHETPELHAAVPRSRRGFRFERWRLRRFGRKVTCGRISARTHISAGGRAEHQNFVPRFRETSRRYPSGGRAATPAGPASQARPRTRTPSAPWWPSSGSCRGKAGPSSDSVLRRSLRETSPQPAAARFASAEGGPAHSVCATRS